MIKISFIILNYNSAKETLNCVNSIFQYYRKLDFEIIIVDNDSNADDLQHLMAIHNSRCKIIKNSINLGFGGGNMVGANLAHGKFLCFLNSDIKIGEDCITPLCNDLTIYSHIGCITPQQYNFKNKLQPSFKHSLGFRRSLLGDQLFEKYFPKEFPNRKNPPQNTLFKVAEINGCFMLFPTNVFWKIGGFDRNIFLFYEEYDISQRLQKIGYINAVDTRYKFYHIHGATMNKSKKITTRERYISRIYCYSKYHNSISTLIFKTITLIQLGLKPHKWYIIPPLLKRDIISQSMKNQLLSTNKKLQDRSN
jgi:GT2 family glycosyltransferase